MKDFEIGDRVIIRTRFTCDENFNGLEGTIIKLKPYIVQFDELVKDNNRICKARSFWSNEMEYIKKRILNLEDDPFGEENYEKIQST